MKKLAVWLLCGLLIVAGVNGFYVTGPAVLAAREDARNDKVVMVPHLRFGVDPTVIVMDLIKIDSEASMADVTRVMLQMAHGLRDRSFSSAHLAYRGRTRFVLSGADFKVLGEEYGPQNPVYTMRTLPEKLARPDGARAFDTWTGGVIGVLSRQMEDFQAFHREWYLNEVI